MCFSAARGVLLRILGGGVSPGSPNPDPFSDRYVHKILLVSSKTIPDSKPKWTKSILVFRPKRENHTRAIPCGAAHTYMGYIREYPREC